MKKWITQLTIVALVVNLAACSTNTTRENTMVGAGTGAVVGGLAGSLASGAGRGWVIAAGAVVGALVGGYVGHSMDSTDKDHMNTAMDNNAINKPSNWKNDKTGVWYKIVPTSDVMEYKGSTHCRHYDAFGKTKSGKTKKTSGIACRDAHGMWYQVK